jgi:hypothetical protein
VARARASSASASPDSTAARAIGATSETLTWGGVRTQQAPQPVGHARPVAVETASVAASAAR